MERQLKVDTRQQAGKHEHKNKWWASHGVSTVVCKLDFGDYAVDGSNVVVDTKRNLAEVSQNISREHARFKREILRARDAGYRLVILIENDEGVFDLPTLTKWTNSHCRHCRYYCRECDPRDAKGKCKKHGTNKPIQGKQLARAMQTMREKYGVRFEFCLPEDAAWRICCLLGIKYDWLCCDCHEFKTCEDAQETKAMCDRGCPF